MGSLYFENGLIWGEGLFKENVGFKIQVDGEHDKAIQLSEDSLIIPSLTEFHCHLWAPGAEIGVRSDDLLNAGVSAVADAGTFGYLGWKDAVDYWKECPVQVRAWLSILPEGLTPYPNTKNPTHPNNISLDKIIETVLANSEIFLGLKLRLGVVDAETDRLLLKLIRNAADKLGARIMVHLTGTELSIEEVVDYLHNGDIITHPFQGKKGNVLDSNGSVNKKFIDAVGRGVLLDIGHGNNHFKWTVFQKCLAEGIKPDTISTDLTVNSVGKPPVFGLSNLMSKMVAGGLTKEEVFKSILETAPNLMGVKISNSKNVVVLSQNKKEVKYLDCHKNFIVGNVSYEVEHVIVNNNSINHQFC